MCRLAHHNFSHFGVSGALVEELVVGDPGGLGAIDGLVVQALPVVLRETQRIEVLERRLGPGGNLRALQSRLLRGFLDGVLHPWRCRFGGGTAQDPPVLVQIHQGAHDGLLVGGELEFGPCGGFRVGLEGAALGGLRPLVHILERGLQALRVAPGFLHQRQAEPRGVSLRHPGLLHCVDSGNNLVPGFPEYRELHGHIAQRLLLGSSRVAKLLSEHLASVNPQHGPLRCCAPHRGHPRRPRPE
mmetsp:Transcript_58108/g.155319  ORF Transcript_58108/g.155319 Transcript_58108/m.155319 type:complete len:243 (-) Transcript_58108:1358-2086(-)